MKNCYANGYFFSRSKTLLSVLLLAFILHNAHAQQQAGYNIIPYPAKLTPQAGSFTINNKTVLITPGNNTFVNEAGFLKQLIQNYLGTGALQTANSGGANAIVLRYDASLTGNEGYTLNISNQLITLSAKDGAGMFYAIETLRQLLPADVETEKGQTLTVPCVQIADKPAFEWRGMMLDVSRHFFSMQYLEKYVNMMALYKLNKLHLHLTDDQGWRIEIKKYPKLTEEGAWRTFNNQDTACMQKAEATGNTDMAIDQSHIIHKNGQTLYGGFYTQDEMRAFIKYAAARHIEVIPEIDMPGHMMAAVKIYPWLTCDTLVGNSVYDFSNPICPCNDKVLDFAKDIFTEIAALFPSKYIHIGGDEVNKKSWAQSAVVKDFMQKKGYTDMNQVQSYFNDYMLAFFKSKGKTLLGWDEIIEGGIDSSAVMMFWRTWAPGAPAKAAANNNKIVMTADGPLYFDAIPDAQSLPAVYNYDPVSSIYHLDDKGKKQVIGVQANLWTEMVPAEKRADYLTMPRLTALAETGWSHNYNYKSYQQRLNAQYERLDRLNISYRMPDLADLADNYAVIDKTPFYVASPVKRFKVHYTLDGTQPNANSPEMDKPVIIDSSLVMKMALFTPAGHGGDVYTLNFTAKQYSKPENVAGTVNGLTTELYKGSFALTTAIKGTPDSVFIATGVAVPPTITYDVFGLKFKGYINVPATGIYTFYLTANDGGVLYIAGQKIVDNDGLHPDKTRGGQAGLQKGLQAIAVNFMEGGGGYALALKYSFNGSEPKPVPAAWFKTQGR